MRSQDIQNVDLYIYYMYSTVFTVLYITHLLNYMSNVRHYVSPRCLISRVYNIFYRCETCMSECVCVSVTLRECLSSLTFLMIVIFMNIYGREGSLCSRVKAPK